MVSVEFGPVLQVVRCGSEELQLGLIRFRRCSLLLFFFFQTLRISSLMWMTPMNTNMFMGLLCVVPALLASGFHHLLHLSHMNVVMCFNCKYACMQCCDAHV